MDPADAGQTFTISRMLDAPRPLVFAAFTEPERMKHWWGPKGFAVIKSAMDLRPGGSYHYGLRAPDGSIIWGRFIYREIDAPERIVLVNSFSDEKGGLSRHPGHETWPLEMLSEFRFEEAAPGQTKFTVTWSPLDANAEEQATFAAGHASMTQGWSGTFEQLATYLATVKKEK